MQNRVPTARTTKQASCWTRSGKAAEYRDSFSKDTFYDLRHELVLRHLRNREIQTEESTAPDQALRLEERIAALVLAGEEDHVAGFGILPAEMLRAAETC